eukprot:4520548-Ditylum_brightwellii.AAC.1
MPVVDHSEINGFDANEHIGFEFVHKDKREVSTKTKVIEVDEETGKVLLEYVHGELELFEPKIIQEVLQSRNQHEDKDDPSLFSKILDHRTVTNRKTEVEVPWDNRETSWDPLAVLHKDDPVTLAGYIKERRLLEQRSWKWAKIIARHKKNFVRMLKLMKAPKKYQK